MYWRYTDVARGGFGYNRRLLRRGIQRRRGGHGRVREKVGGRGVGGRRVEKRAGEGGCCRTASRSTSL